MLAVFSVCDGSLIRGGYFDSQRRHEQVTVRWSQFAQAATLQGPNEYKWYNREFWADHSLAKATSSVVDAAIAVDTRRGSINNAIVGTSELTPENKNGICASTRSVPCYQKQLHFWAQQSVFDRPHSRSLIVVNKDKVNEMRLLQSAWLSPLALAVVRLYPWKNYPFSIKVRLLLRCRYI